MTAFRCTAARGWWFITSDVLVWWCNRYTSNAVLQRLQFSIRTSGIAVKVWDMIRFHSVTNDSGCRVLNALSRRNRPCRPADMVPVGQFSKNIARLVGQLRSGSRLVGRIGSGVRVSASFKRCPPRGSVRVRTPASWQAKPMYCRSTGSIDSVGRPTGPMWCLPTP